jgi:hypothetical protein
LALPVFDGLETRPQQGWLSAAGGVPGGIRVTQEIRTRPLWFRFVMGAGCVLFLLSAVFLCASPLVGRDLNVLDVAVAGFSLFVAFVAGQIALTGKPPEAGNESRSRRHRLITAANRYAAGDMTLEEYGTITRKLLEEGGKWRRLAMEGKKLEACKLYKQETGVSLMEAKKAVEAFMES